MDEHDEKNKSTVPQQGDDKPEAHEHDDAVTDLKKGIGLLFRAAKSAAQGAAHRAKDATQSEKVEKAFKTGAHDLQKAFDRLQSDKLEGAIKSSLQEIGRAVGNVAQTIEREIRGQGPGQSPPRSDVRDEDETNKKS